MTRLACLRVPCFAAAAAARCEPELAERPLAVVQGSPPATRVVEASAAAREQGVEPGMPEAQARARCPALITRPFDDERLASAQHALLEVALGVSPEVEDGGPGLVYVEISGLAGLFGDAAAIGGRLLRLAAGIGLPARVGIAGTRAAARVASHGPGRVTVIRPGEERAALASTPVSVLDLPAEVAAALARWGVRELGQLAALPRPALAARLGPAGLAAHDLATGADRTPLARWTPPPFWAEAQGLDWEITDSLALAAVLQRVLERLAARLDAAHLAADTLDVRLGLVSGAHDERSVALAHATRDAGVMLALIRLELERQPPAAPVTHVAVSARVVPARAGQGGLWQPPAPAPRDMATLLGRLVRLVGRDNVGSPVLDDSHRPDAFTLVPFAPPDTAAGPAGAGDEAPLALRRLRPPRPVEVVVGDGRPVRVRRGPASSRVVAGAGPWRGSGEWWDTRGWARDEWDLLLDDGTLCRLAFDHRRGEWVLDGIYD